MHIALVSPLYESVPPQLYGGTERVVANLCAGLAKLGHHVTLFASGDSYIHGVEVCPAIPKALRLSEQAIYYSPGYHLVQARKVMDRSIEFDIVHNHMDCFGFVMEKTEVAFVSTMHGRLDDDATKLVLKHFADTPLVSISNAQRAPVKDSNWVRTIYHGIEVSDFKYNAQKGSYLAYLGRISPEKRPDWAIDIAKRSGVPLKIAAKIDPKDKEYYEAVIKRHIDGKFIEFIGEISEKEKSEFLGGALGLVFPIDWPEPFGIVPLEAWACGTPVLARPCGSVPELHKDRVTGFIREYVEDLVKCVPLLENFDRALCRKYVSDHFSLDRMCQEYLKVYEQIIHRKRRRHSNSWHQSSDRSGRNILHPLGRTPSGNKEDRAQGE